LEEKPKEEVKGLKELWNVKVLRRNLSFSILLWSANMFNFYLLTFYIKYFPGNIYQNTITFACTDIVAYVISGFIMKFLNTNKSLYVCYVASTAGALLYLIFEHKENLIPIFIILCRIGTNMAFSVTYCTNARLYPT